MVADRFGMGWMVTFAAIKNELIHCKREPGILETNYDRRKKYFIR